MVGLHGKFLMKMSARVSDGFFCQLKKNVKNPQGRQSFISLNGKIPVAFSGSADHYAFLDKSGKAFGFGNNNQHQISKNAGPRISIPFPLDFDEELFEIACGKEFTVGISKSNKILVAGDAYTNLKLDKLRGLRGLSAFDSKFVFISDENNIHIYTDSNNCINTKAPGQLIASAINSKTIAVMNNNGDIYTAKIGEEMKLLCNGISLFAGSESLIIVQNKCKLLLYQSEKSTEFYLPSGFECAKAGFENGDLLILDTSGNLQHASMKSKTFSSISNNFVGIQSLPLHGPISSFVLLGDRFLFINGKPQKAVKPGNFLPIESGTEISSPQFKDTFLVSSSETAYLANSRIPVEGVATYLAGKAGDIFFTALDRPVKLDQSAEVLFSVNLLANDKVTIGSTDAVVAGYAQGALWVIPEGRSRVFAACDFSIKDVMESIELVSRPNHSIKKMYIDGVLAYADTTPEFVQKFGYAVGDLIWVPQKGTCEVIGVYSNMLVILDISSRKVFSQKLIKFKVLRRNSEDLPHTRDVMRIDGVRVTIDISAKGSRLFVPTDRVITPIGFATVLGFADTAYVQTDEMRINGYEAAPVSVLDMQLVRRISMPAVRTIETIDGQKVRVSLNTESSTDGIMPGDILAIGSTYARAVGVNENGWYAVYLGHKKARLLPPSNTANIVYRSDFMATRSDAQGLQVGSPGIGESLILPGDIINMKEFEQCEFMGYNDTSMVFVSHETGELISLTFSTSLIPDLFTVIKRPAMEFLGPQASNQ